ncbi:prepilin-type N-terminal cleavage/methylation domain-containing protein [Aliamphritea spongicola]|nr:prepilin-type N-terminal cleavage/methylation domain-containing protein [Aliamphritea spongicola]
MQIPEYSYRSFSQRGLSMIELMVSMLIGLIIMGAVLQVFLSSNQSYRIQEAQSRIQEDGRAAIHFISQDIRGADFWGVHRISQCSPVNWMPVILTIIRQQSMTLLEILQSLVLIVPVQAAVTA